MSLFVGRIPKYTRARELEDVFIKYGRIIRCDVKSGSNGGTEADLHRILFC